MFESLGVTSLPKLLLSALGEGGGGMYNVQVIDWERRSRFGFKELEIQILPYHFHIFFSPPFL